MISGESSDESSCGENEMDENKISVIVGINQPSFATGNGVLLYYVKYSGFSYLRCQWKTEEDIFFENRAVLAFFKSKNRESVFIPVHYVSGLYIPKNSTFNEKFITPARILATRDGPEYLLEWEGLPIHQSTWEFDASPELIEKFQNSCGISNPISGLNMKKYKERKCVQFDGNVCFKDSLKLNDYQVSGLNWLCYKWHQSQSVILADEMGLGKTIQSLAFLQYLKHSFQVSGPFIVVVPLSTIRNWEDEIKKWTTLNILTYIGNGKDRLIMQKYLFFSGSKENHIKFDLLLTSYDILSKDLLFLRSIKWIVAIYDEAHKLKNHKSKIYESCFSIKSDHTILLTGTPIQNSIEEIWSLLHFIDTNCFPSIDGFLRSYSDMSSENIRELQVLIEPYILRRKKSDVEISLKPKEETIIEVELSQFQRMAYRMTLDDHREELMSSISKNPINLNNLSMDLRKICNHPFLINHFEILAKEQAKATNKVADNDSLSYEQECQCMIDSSGKLILINKLLPKLKENGHKVLIFSQMTSVLDIIADYLDYKNFTYERLDGTNNIQQRSSSIDRFCSDENLFVFLLSTKAGGLGINLTVADTVIIYDSDWNPQNDIQAMSRCHRIGQTQEVKVYRLISRATYESEMFERASKKLGLDYALLDSGQTNNDNTPNGKDLELLIRKGAYAILTNTDNNQIEQFCQEDIEQILENRTHCLKPDVVYGSNSLFSKVSFSSLPEDEEIESQSFWVKFFPKDEKSQNVRYRQKKNLSLTSHQGKLMKKSECKELIALLLSNGFFRIVLYNSKIEAKTIHLMGCIVLYAVNSLIGFRSYYSFYRKYVLQFVKDATIDNNTFEMMPFDDSIFMEQAFNGNLGIFLSTIYQIDSQILICSYYSSELIKSGLSYGKSMTIPLLWSTIYDYILVFIDSPNVDYSVHLPKIGDLNVDWCKKRARILQYELMSIIKEKEFSVIKPLSPNEFGRIYIDQSYTIPVNFIKRMLKGFYLYGIPIDQFESFEKFAEHCRSLFSMKSINLKAFTNHVYIILLKMGMGDKVHYHPSGMVPNLNWIPSNILNSICEHNEILGTIRMLSKQHNLSAKLLFGCPSPEGTTEWTLNYDLGLISVVIKYGMISSSRVLLEPSFKTLKSEISQKIIDDSLNIEMISLSPYIDPQLSLLEFLAKTKLVKKHLINIINTIYANTIDISSGFKFISKKALPNAVKSTLAVCGNHQTIVFNITISHPESTIESKQFTIRSNNLNDLYQTFKSRLSKINMPIPPYPADFLL